MPVGRPDYSQAGRAPNVARLQDDGELAVRLGSMVNFDRTGQVIWQDAFTRFDASYQVVSVGVIGAPAVSNVYAESQNSSLLFTIGAGAANNITIYKYMRNWLQSLLSVELAVLATEAPNDVELSLRNGEDDESIRGALKLTLGCRYLSYMDSTGVWQQIHDFGLSVVHDYYFVALKLDIDTYNRVYKRIRVDSDTFDLSDIPLRITALPGKDMMMSYFRVWANNVNNTPVYVDRLIITEDQD